MTQHWEKSGTLSVERDRPDYGSTFVDYHIVEQLHQRLIRDIDESVLQGLDREQAREQVERATRTLVTELFPQLVGDTKEEAIDHVVDEVTGLGPIEPLLRDPTVSEAMVNSPAEVYYDRDGII